MPEMNRDSAHLQQIREILRDWENYRPDYDPEFARKYAGQWVKIYRGEVVAHGKTGSEVAEKAPAEDYPGGEILYVPTLEQQVTCGRETLSLQHRT